ncbi:NME NM23 member 5 [Apophysomyces sp. BC1034]|nr:NME NM23 member 5 [Apophysomyces sp. BC1015]KAG0180888.1 NME NM23 member 5 [Apophysomyces sp. BC1021]KAG0191062.1 NME NM23 member 5 [Apophysomyces sp. BC1034]
MFWAYLIVLFLHFSPFLFLLCVPSNSLANKEDIKYEICQYLPQAVQNVACPLEQTLAVIKPDGMASQSLVMAMIKQRGFNVLAEKQVQLSPAAVAEWYHDKIGRDFYPSLEAYLTRGPCYAIILQRVDAIKGLRRLVGPTNPEQARQVAPRSVRAHIGTSIQENAIHASDSGEAFRREKKLLF